MPGDFTKYKELRYALAGIPSADLPDYDKLFIIETDSDIAAELSAGGGIAVYLPNGSTPVPFGLYPQTNLAAGTVVFRCRIEPLSSASVGNPYVRLYYSSTGTTVEDKAAVVADWFCLFAPLEEDPDTSAPQILDWVTNTLLGTLHGTSLPSDVTAAQVGNGLTLLNDWINFDQPSGSEGGNALTVGAIVRPNAVDNGTRTFIGRLNGPFNNGWVLRQENTHLKFYGYIDGDYRQASYNDVMDDTAFQSVVGRYDGTTGQVFHNGVPGTSFTRTGGIVTSSDDLLVGAIDAGGSDLADGVFDEVWISAEIWPDERIAYRTADDLANASTFTIGPEEEEGGGGGITEDFDPVVATSSVVSVFLLLAHSFSPVSAVGGVVAVGQQLSYLMAAVSAASSVNQQSTALGNSVTPVTAAITVPTFTNTGSGVNEQMDPVTLEGSVTQAQTILSFASAPIVAVATVPSFGMALGNTQTPVVATVTIPEFVVLRSETPEVAEVASSVGAWELLLAYTFQPVTAVGSIPAFTIIGPTEPAEGGPVWSCSNPRVWNSIQPRVWFAVGGHMASALETLYISPGENKTFGFDFSKEGAVKAGEEISSPSASVTPLTGTPPVLGSPQILDEEFVDSGNAGKRIAAGKGAKMRIQAGTAGTYFVTVSVTTSGGDILNLKGKLMVR